MTCVPIILMCHELYDADVSYSNPAQARTISNHEIMHVFGAESATKSGKRIRVRTVSLTALLPVRRLPGGVTPVSNLTDLLSDCIPNDHCRQVTSRQLATSLCAYLKGVRQIMDLGCGEGESCDLFRKIAPRAHWIGLDIAGSSHTTKPLGADSRIATYDGTRMPFADGCMDLIYCNQVLEHVRHTREVLKEVCRVLGPGGRFIGSTSHLEPFHACSVWNYTPYGFRVLIEEAGLQLLEIRPGIDALTLIIRRGLGSPAFFARWWDRESPLNRAIGFYGRLTGKPHCWVNSAKLQFCGQFGFIAQRWE